MTNKATLNKVAYVLCTTKTTTPPPTIAVYLIGLHKGLHTRGDKFLFQCLHERAGEESPL